MFYEVDEPVNCLIKYESVHLGKRDPLQSLEPNLALCYILCVCVYLQVVVVRLAAAVSVLGAALVQVENTADVTEVSGFRDHELLTWRDTQTQT